MNPDIPNENILYSQIEELLQTARKKVVSYVNQTMAYTYFVIGKTIVEFEQDGQERATYGRSLLKGISKRLTQDFGKGFSVDNLENMRRFYLAYSKSETLSRKSETVAFPLSWSHYLTLMRIDGLSERQFYEIEAAKNNWSVRGHPS